jgi:hypothetical protein
MLAKIACVAIKQSFAVRGVTAAHGHRAYKCAALRAASRASGAGQGQDARIARPDGEYAEAPIVFIP